MLTWISIYLFSLPGPAESVRIYYELVNAPGFSGFTPAYSPTPVGCSYFPKELFVMPKAYASTIDIVVPRSMLTEQPQVGAHGRKGDIRVRA